MGTFTRSGTASFRALMAGVPEAVVRSWVGYVDPDTLNVVHAHRRCRQSVGDAAPRGGAQSSEPQRQGAGR